MVSSVLGHLLPKAAGLCPSGDLSHGWGPVALTPFGTDWWAFWAHLAAALGSGKQRSVMQPVPGPGQCRQEGDWEASWGFWVAPPLPAWLATLLACPPTWGHPAWPHLGFQQKLRLHLQ